MEKLVLDITLKGYPGKKKCRKGGRQFQVEETTEGPGDLACLGLSHFLGHGPFRTEMGTVLGRPA